MHYALMTIEHKWYVMLACRKTKVPLWRALIHDLSKFSPSEMRDYNEWFSKRTNPDGFALAWLHHQNHNPHHWEYWITRTEHSFAAGVDIVDGCLPMPETYIREMVADWMGASKSYTGSWDMTAWLEKNLPCIKLHPESREKLTSILLEQGYTDGH